MDLNAYKKWLAFGSGAGIEIGDRDLEVTLVRVRPAGARVIASMTVERYAERPANEWGHEYAAFLKKNGATHISAAVLLPRRDVIVRQIAMPGVASGDLANAVRFQIDGLHPYSEDEAVYDWGRLDDAGNILVGITRREVVDRFVSLFAEAGIKVAAFTFSAAVLHSAIRLFGPPPSGGFLILERHGDELEVYGESEARPVFTATFDTPSEPFVVRAVSLALSELRLPVATEPAPVYSALPAPVSTPEGYRLTVNALPYATALAGACPHLGASANLLPPELRETSSRAMYVPSIVLGILLVLGLAALTIYSSYEDRKYLRALEAEIHRLEPIARKPMALDRSIAVSRQRAQLLDAFRKRSQADLDAIGELTRLLAPPGFVSSLEMTRDQVRFSGEIQQSEGLVKILDQSPFFEASDFTMPIAHTATGDTFSIRSRREGALP